MRPERFELEAFGGVSQAKRRRETPAEIPSGARDLEVPEKTWEDMVRPERFELEASWRREPSEAQAGASSRNPEWSEGSQGKVKPEE